MSFFLHSGIVHESALYLHLSENLYETWEKYGSEKEKTGRIRMKLHQVYPGLNLIDLESGEEVRPDPARGLACFFMAEQLRDAGRIRKIARPFLQAGCRRFGFFGGQAEAWRSVLEQHAADRLEAGDEGAMQMRGYATREAFLEDVRKALEDETNEVYLLYNHQEDVSGILFGLLFGDPVYPDSV